MRKRRLVCILMMLCAVIRINAQEKYSERAVRYIEQYRDWAIAEQQRTGVPAAITLAQGIHETSGGQSELAANANNHFGIKCKKDWTGQTYSYTDDAPNECFRKYESVLSSYRDHSDYLLTNKRYASLFELEITDYKGWATGLKRCGYATNPKYAQILIKLIEDYRLNDITVAALSPVRNPVREAEKPAGAPDLRTVKVQKEVVPEQDAPVVASSPVIEDNPAAPAASKKNRIQVSYGSSISDLKAGKVPEPGEAPVTETQSDGIIRVNDLKAFFARKGTVLLQDAIRHNIRYAKLLELNDLPDAPLEADMYIYLEKKHTTGETKEHIVAAGETLLQIAQKQGMQLKYLKAYNKIGANEEPVEGAVLQLMDYAAAKPATYAKAVAPRETATPMLRDDLGRKAIKADEGYIAKKDLGKGGALEMDRPLMTKEEIAALEVNRDLKEQSINFLPVIIVQRQSAPELTLPAREEDAALPVAAVAALSTTVPGINQEKTQAPASETPAVQTESPATAVATTDTGNAPAEASVVVQAETPAPDRSEDINNVTAGQPVPDSGTVAAGTEAEKQEVINIANEVAIEEVIRQAHEEAKDDGGDEFTRLKAKLDKVVYASDKAAENKQARVEKAAAFPDKSVFYTVKKGDTAFSIAKRHKISMQQLRDWNNLAFQEIKPGQQLRVK